MLTVQEMAKIAAKHHPDGKTVEEYEQIISNRPSAWIQFCESKLNAEKFERKVAAKPKFTGNQKELINLIKKQPVWRCYFDAPTTPMWKRTLDSLVARRVIERVDLGSDIEYKLLADFRK